MIIKNCELRLNLHKSPYTVTTYITRIKSTSGYSVPTNFKDTEKRKCFRPGIRNTDIAGVGNGACQPDGGFLF